jgi:hypothetical protein
VLAVWAAGSAVGGLLYGSRSWPTTARSQLRLSISPGGAGLLAELSKNLAPTRGLTAFAWLASVNRLASPLPYAVAGVLVGKAGP